MAKFLVLEKSFIDGRVVEADTEIEFDDFPGPNLKPLDNEAKALAAQTPSDDVSLARMGQSTKSDAKLPVLKPKK